MLHLKGEGLAAPVCTSLELRFEMYGSHVDHYHSSFVKQRDQNNLHKTSTIKIAENQEITLATYLHQDVLSPLTTGIMCKLSPINISDVNKMLVFSIRSTGDS